MDDKSENFIFDSFLASSCLLVSVVFDGLPGHRTRTFGWNSQLQSIRLVFSIHCREICRNAVLLIHTLVQSNFTTPPGGEITATHSNACKAIVLICWSYGYVSCKKLLLWALTSRQGHDDRESINSPQPRRFYKIKNYLRHIVTHCQKARINAHLLHYCAP